MAINTPIDYPVMLPLECITESLNIIRSGDLLSRKSELGKYLWVIQGYAQGLLLGDPEGPHVTASLPPEFENDPVAALESFVPKDGVVGSLNLNAQTKALLKFVLEQLIALYLS